MPTRFDTTIEAFKGDITKLELAQGVKNIEGWITTLEKMDFRGSKTIYDNLAKLKNLLQAQKTDGPAIVELLHLLGEETARAGNTANEAKGEKLKQLGDLLTKARPSTKAKSK